MENPAIWLSLALISVLAAAPSVAEADDTGVEEKPAGGDEEGGLDPASARPPVGLSGVELEELESDYAPEVERFFIPPYYQETAGAVDLKLFFPIFFYRTRTGEGARTDLGVLPFYWRYREGLSSADVYLLLYWRFRDPTFDTDLVLQTYYNRSDHGYNFGFAPLVFTGEDTRDESSYCVVPPLYWQFAEGESLFRLAGLLYYENREREDYDLGLFPLFFAGRERDEDYLVVLPPLLWHFGDDIAYTTTTVVPPLFFKTREHGWSAGLLPVLYLAQDVHWARTMVLPFYYGSRWGEGRSHYIFPLLTYYRHSPDLSQGGVAVFYHWYEHAGEYLRAYTPLLWQWGNERSYEESWLVPPLFYRHDSPVSDETMVGLLWWDFHEHHRERTVALAPLFAHNWDLYERHWRTWVVPTFDFGQQPDGYHVRVHPLFYLGEDERSSHLVITPLVWRFADELDEDTVVFPVWWNFHDLEHDALSRVFFPLWWQFDDMKRSQEDRVLFPFYWSFSDEPRDERTTVIFPIGWRDRSPDKSMTGVLNVVWEQGEVKGNPFWKFHLFPLLSFGHPPAPDGAYWSLLYGFLGWRRQGSTKELKLLWIPIDATGD